MAMTNQTTDEHVGHTDGEVCHRRGCRGVIRERPVENCSCHIAPPCGEHTTPRGYCEQCGWNAADDEIINDYVVNVNRETGVHRTWTPRPLDSSKIDWRTKVHTHSSQICQGVYPEGTTREQVEALVKGTFGGRFNYFGNGSFEYVAYTD